MKKIAILFLILSMSMGFLFMTSKHKVMANSAKIFEVDDVLPATTQLRISWTGVLYDFMAEVETDNGNFKLVYQDFMSHYVDDVLVFDHDDGDWVSPYNDTDHAYIDIDTSTWSESKRTISYYFDDSHATLFWEDLNPSQGFSITFEENGGTSVTDLSEQTVLPNPLPTTTKSGYTFVNWYYDSAFTQKANAGDTIESNVTLYAKWLEASITDLTGSKWFIHSPELLAQMHPEEDASEYWTIDFKSGGISFNLLYIEYFESGVTSLEYHSNIGTEMVVCVLNGDDIAYLDESYLNIEIISGDTTSNSLIVLLESIATLQTPVQNYTVSFVSNGGTPIPDRYIVDRLTQLPIPVRANSRFTGWYYDNELSQKANNNDLITDDTILYAGWILNPIYEDLTEARFSEGYSVGFDDGYQTGFGEGAGSVWDEAYEDGYRDALEIADADIKEAWDEGYEFAKEGFGFQKDGKYYDGKSAYMLGYNDNDNLRKLFIPALVIIFVATIILSGINVFRKRD